MNKRTVHRRLCGYREVTAATRGIEVFGEIIYNIPSGVYKSQSAF